MLRHVADHGADITVRDSDGNTALHHALMHMDEDASRMAAAVDELLCVE